MNESHSAMALKDFKKQLDTLSESLNNFDPEERNKALEILQECIQGLENENTTSSDGLYEEMNNEIPITNSLKDSEYALVEDHHQESSILYEKQKEERSDNVQIETHAEEEWKKTLKCPKCNKDYDDKSTLLKHLNTYSGKVRSCVKCHKTFQNSIALKFHKQLEMCVKSHKMYKCKLCSKTLYGESPYNIHLNAHKRNRCNICGDHFARRKHLEAHTANIHNSPISKDLFRCHLCDRTFTQRRSLVYHYKITHPGNDHVCGVCLEMFDSSSELDAHQSTHKQQLFVCDKCHQTFSRKQQYLIHVKEHERYKCATCNDCFSAKKAAEKHAKQGHSVSGLEPQIQCAQCGEMFLSRSLLNSHMITHTGEKTISCEKCKITFKKERNYLSHLETKEHLQGEEPKDLLACKECNKTFTNRNNLRIHISRMHKLNKEEHTCTYCSYKTKVLYNFKRHVALHTEKPQFICDKCGAQLQSKNALQEHHLRLHSDCKEFSCYKCGKMFRGSSDLNRHLTNTHSDVPLYHCHCGNKYKTLNSLKRHQLLNHEKVDVRQTRHQLLKHDKVDKSQAQLVKSFSFENDISKKTSKKSKTKIERNNTIAPKTDKLLLHSQMPAVSTAISDSNTIVMMAERHPGELLEVSYNMNFNGDDKSEVVYAQNLDMNSLQVVESMIQLEGDPSKQGTSVLINVRNLFGRTEYVIPSTIEPSIVEGLTDESQHITVTSQKQDGISSLQEYAIPNDLNFLNVYK